MRTISIWFLACTFFLLSCSDNTKEESIDLLRIIQSNVSFNSNGGQGSINVESSYAISATSNMPWCEVSISNNSLVTIKVDKNLSKEGRIATITISDTSGQSCNVGVTQSGDVLNLQGERTIYFGNNASFSNISVSYNGDINMICDVDWIHTEIYNENIKISVDKNSSSNIRSANIFLEYGTYKDTLTCIQGEFDNMLGKYKLHGYRAVSPGQGMDYNCLCDIVKEGLDYSMHITWENGSPFVSIPIIPVSGSIKALIINGSYLGISRDSYYSLFLCQYAPMVEGGYYIYCYKGPSLTLDFTTDEGKIKGIVRDNGTWPNGIKTNSIYLIACQPNNITDFANYTSIGGFYDGIYDITLEKIDE